MIYTVYWEEKTKRQVSVEAEEEEEAIKKAKCGDVIEGTQDSEPGKDDWSEAYAEESES